MRRTRFLAFLAPVALFAGVHPAAASSKSGFDNIAPLSNEALAEVVGTGSWSLTRANLAMVSDSDSTQNLRWISNISRTQMDVWWGTIGAGLIAQSVRASLPGT